MALPLPSFQEETRRPTGMVFKKRSSSSRGQQRFGFEDSPIQQQCNEDLCTQRNKVRSRKVPNCAAEVGGIHIADGGRNRTPGIQEAPSR